MALKRARSVCAPRFGSRKPELLAQSPASMIIEKVVHALKAKIPWPEANRVRSVYMRVRVERARDVPQTANDKSMLAGFIRKMYKALKGLG